MILRRSKRIAEKEKRNLQNNPETLQEETLQTELNIVLKKMSEYIHKINNTECIVKKLEVCNKLSCLFIDKKNIIKHSVTSVWNYNSLIKIIYNKYNEIWDNIPEMVERYTIPKYKLKHMYALTQIIIHHCKNEIWNYSKYVFKLPLPNDIIRHIILEWL